MPELIYASCEDCENWIAESIDEVVESILGDDAELSEGDLISVYQGEKQAISLAQYLPSISEQIEENAYDDLGDLTTSLFSREQAKSLDDAVKHFVKEYVDKHELHPSFYRVVNVKELQIKITKADDSDISFDLVA